MRRRSTEPLALLSTVRPSPPHGQGDPSLAPKSTDCLPSSIEINPKFYGRGHETLPLGQEAGRKSFALIDARNRNLFPTAQRTHNTPTPTRLLFCMPSHATWGAALARSPGQNDGGHHHARCYTRLHTGASPPCRLLSRATLMPVNRV